MVTEVRNGTVRLQRKERSDKLPPEVLEQVKKFYLNEKNSCILPGKKDMKSVKTKEGRIKVSKQLLLSTIPEAYLKFVEEHGKILSLDMFRKLRPPNVVLAGSAGTHTICCCIGCENPKLMITTSNIWQLEGIKALTPNSDKVTPKEISKELVCSIPTEACYLSSCEQCKDKKKDLQSRLKAILEEEGIETIEYTQWLITQSSQFETFNKPVEDFCSDFVHAMNSFKTHNFIHSKQSSYLYELKKNPPIGTILIWMDYAENYACVSQNEVQQAYFKKLQISMLTVYVYMLVNGQVKEQSYVVLTDDCRHEKTPSVWASYKKLVVKLDELFPARTRTILVTDGCAGNLFVLIQVLCLSVTKITI